MRDPRYVHQKIRGSVKREPDGRSSNYLPNLNKALVATEAMFFLTKLLFLFNECEAFSLLIIKIFLCWAKGGDVLCHGLITILSYTINYFYQRYIGMAPFSI